MTEAGGVRDPKDVLSDLGLSWWNRHRALSELNRSRADLVLVEAALHERLSILDRTAGDLGTRSGYSPEQARMLGTVDLFVEKAQQVLTTRSRQMARRAVVATSVVVVLMVAAACLVGYLILKKPPAPEDFSTNVLLLRIAQSLSFGAFGFVAVKYLVSLARAFFHESTKLLDRRHALRFGRMYVHLNAASLPVDAHVSEARFDVEALVRAFEWNIDAPSAFLDMDPKAIADTIWNRIVASAGSVPSDVAVAVVGAKSKTT